MKNNIIFAAALCAALLLSSCCGGNKTSNEQTAEAAAGQCCQNSENMIKIITAYKFIKPEKVDEFVEFVKPIVEKSRAEEGCISYTLYQDPTDPTKFMFYEEWKGQEAIDFHFSTDHFKLSGSRADEFESAPTVLTIYDAAPVK
ncbi:MAG: antibiotic biosynthesis monooxygenase [Alistipes sp.]|nr:antibiotic biosynthesis monooxygenase [Alistipes sp.]